MAQISESVATDRALLAERAAPGIQDVFLNKARRDRVTLSVHLMDGRVFDARIKSFDRFAVLIDVDGAEQLVFKHAIATIAAPQPLVGHAVHQA